MDPAVEKLEAQIRRWSMIIDEVAAKAQKAGAQARFEDLTHVDELKALLAIAQSKLDRFRAGGGTEAARLKAEMSRAWKDLDAALSPLP